MSGCTLRFTRNSPLRTTLIDESTGHAKYQIDTPITAARAITRIRKFDSHTHSLHWHDDPDSDSGDDEGDEKQMLMGDEYDTEGGDYAEAEAELPETSDEIAKIYWQWFSTERIVFQGVLHLRNEFLPKCGKLKGSYTFAGPDGVQYRWALGALGLTHPRLFTADENKAMVAEFHPANYIVNRRKARLEV